MSHILVIESSIRQQDSVSRRLAKSFVKQWQIAHPQDEFKFRDLAAQPVPHMDDVLLGGLMKPAGERSAAEKQAVERGDALIDEVKWADVLVLSLPMYNFAIPSTVKSWLDHVLRAGETFCYTENGPRGLLQGKRAYVLTARGGVYAGSALDHQEPYLRQILAFIGINDVTFIHAEGMSMGGDAAEKGIAQAMEKVSQVA